jgi:hypothetical protein
MHSYTSRSVFPLVFPVLYITESYFYFKLYSVENGMSEYYCALEKGMEKCL